MPTSAYDPSFVIRTPKLDDIAARENGDAGMSTLDTVPRQDP